MTIFEAYLITTLIPNLSDMSGIFCFVLLISIIASLLLTAVADFDSDFWKGTKRYLKYAIPALVFVSILTATLPTQKQMAAIFAVKIASSEDAKEIYGEAGDLLKEWLKEQTQELVTEKEAE